MPIQRGVMQKIDFAWSTPKIPFLPVNGSRMDQHGCNHINSRVGEHIGRYEHVAKMFTDNHMLHRRRCGGHGKSAVSAGILMRMMIFEIIDGCFETQADIPGCHHFYSHSLGTTWGYYTQKRRSRFRMMPSPDWNHQRSAFKMALENLVNLSPLQFTNSRELVCLMKLWCL
jgi:hypothetical protein